MEASGDIVRARAAGSPGPMAAAILVWCALAVVSSLYVTIPLTPLLADRFGVSGIEIGRAHV